MSSINKNVISQSDSRVELDDIGLLDSIDSMPINVAGDSYRENQVIINGMKVQIPKNNKMMQKLKEVKAKGSNGKETITEILSEIKSGGRKTMRDPTPAPPGKPTEKPSVPVQKSSKRVSDQTEKCANCHCLQRTLEELRIGYVEETDQMKAEIQTYKSVLLKIKGYLSLNGELDFSSEK